MEHKYKEFPMQKSEGDAGTISGYFSHTTGSRTATAM